MNSQSQLTYPIPPDFLMQQILGPKATSEGYLYGGYVVSAGIRRILRLVGRRFQDFKYVLDFGCGCARVLRWFHDLRPSSIFYGTDISQEAINWCKENIPFAKFTKNDPFPPLPFPNESFDLVYGVSVFTHLDEEYQFAWLKELQRITRPGAIIMLTAHGDSKAYMDLSDEEYVQFQNNGFVYKRAVEHGGVDGLPDFYQVTYHSRHYVERIWSKFFRISVYLRHGPLWLQDLVLMEKPRKKSLASNHKHELSYVYLDLPIANLEVPRLGALVNEDQIGVSGWAFHPDGGTVNLDLWIDGERFESCVTEIPRPDVAEAYPRCPSAKLSGFATTIPSKNLSEGLHVFEVSARTNIVPLCLTYFLKES